MLIKKIVGFFTSLRLTSVLLAFAIILVFVGTLAETGALIIEAKRVGEDTTLARITQLVEQAQQREAPIQRTLDRAAGWLVPVMLSRWTMLCSSLSAWAL